MFFKSYYSGYRERNKEKGYVVNVRFNSIQSPEIMDRLLGVVSPVISNDAGFDGSSKYTPQTKQKQFDNALKDYSVNPYPRRRTGDELFTICPKCEKRYKSRLTQKFCSYSCAAKSRQQ